MTDQTNHEKWMRVALAQARIAESLGEVPIGAVIVKDDKVIAKAYNLRETTCRASAHAELLAIDQANHHLNRWRLEGCTLYVSLEPCAMCSGAIILARLDRVVFAAADPKAGCSGSLMNLLEDTRFNHQPQIISGILEKDAGDLLRNFFKKLRERNKLAKVTLQRQATLKQVTIKGND